MSQSLPALLPTQWLASRLGAPGIVTLDATFCLPQQNRDAYREFKSEHIPGSQFFDIDVISDQDSPLPHMLPEAKQFEAAVGRLGINNDTMIVVYDNNSFMASARVWWTFRVFGHRKIAVLDGGLKVWKAESRTLVNCCLPPRQQQFIANFQANLVKNIEQIKNLIANNEATIVDARSANRFAGSESEFRPGLKSGHIPGSHNLPYSLLLNADTGQLKNTEQLMEVFNQTKINTGLPIVATCGSGVSASILALSLYLLGNKTVPVYDGSWSDWGSATGVQIATGN